MSYEKFCEYMNKLANNSEGILVNIFRENEEYVAEFSNGSKIIGSSVSLKLRFYPVK